MMKFSDFIAQTPQEAPKGIEISGSFGCQSCYVLVDEAEYFRAEKILKWVCPDGHISYVEEFVL